ncbi:diguanylate cyclase [Rhabdochromatium marinum]|nr:GGDEF domain-containing protein [Rhabdochromatium marinum]MBK1649230.1 diguanylate cyclase [Rhabdochromatium marinum]
MTLNRKITLLLAALALGILAALLAISLYAFRSLSIASSQTHVQTAAEIVRVLLTESMINGVINKREQALERLRQIRNLHSVRIARSEHVNRQFGAGLAREMQSDEIEQRVLADGLPRFYLLEDHGQPVFRGTIPYIASAQGRPNCLECHQVEEGTVLGAVTIELSLEDLRRHGIYSVLAVLLAVALISTLAILSARRLILPVGATATAIGEAVQRGLHGDFKTHITERTKDDIGQIAAHTNRLLAFLDQGLSSIGDRVAQLVGRPPQQHENQLQATIEMVEALTEATHFKATIEEDQTATEIYIRFARLLRERFALSESSFYEAAEGNQLTIVAVDGQIGGACRWCQPEIMVRSDLCRAKRSGRPVDGLRQAEICFAFAPDTNTEEPYRHYCIPLIQSGAVGSIIQLIVPEARCGEMIDQLPFVQVYLREMTPVLEAKRLMETLRDSSLRDAMTGLNNRRFLEEYIEPLTAAIRRRNSRLGLLMADLDYFKMVNDTHGHDVGDAILKELAKILQTSLRASDLCVRFGGEEFLIILQDTDETGTLEVAEKIRERVASYRFQAGTSVLEKTLSIGVALFPDDSENFWQALKYADVALYRAKLDGRNRVVRFTADMWEQNGACY